LYRIMTKPTRSWTLPLLVALALAATGISRMLTSYHLTQGKDPGAVFRLACDAEEGGCADVLASPWATGPGGIPTATYGAVYFGALALWYLVVGRPRGQGRYWHAVPLGLNLAGALFSAFLVSVMLGGLGGVCWWCMLTHLINFAMLFLAWRMWREVEGQDWPPARLGLAGVLLMIAWAVLCVQGLMVSAARRAAREASDYARTFYEDTDLQRYLQQRQASTALPIRPDDPVRGNPAAPHTAVVFSDFQCPACRSFAEFFDSQVLPAVGDRVRIVYKHFPLEPECNPVVQHIVHEHACEAAEMAEAARSLGGSAAFWNMHDRLFRVQTALGPGLWPTLAQEAGLDPARIAELMSSRAFSNRLREDADLGRRLDIQATPTVFLDGKKMDEWRRLDVWQALTK
jgi:protein-disulfide isomerase/uncharacterized membrane protein